MTLDASARPSEASVVRYAPKPVPMRQPRSPRYDRLTPADCARLHDASLAILERTGVRLHDDEAVERLHGAGARVGDDGRVFVPGVARGVGAVGRAPVGDAPRRGGAARDRARG